MENLQQLFEYRLQNVYAAEYDLLDLLQELAGETRDATLQRALADQRNAILVHIKRLERIFKLLGRQPEERRSQELDGIIRMKREFADERPTPDLRDFFNREVAREIQHFQIASYETLVALASATNMPTVQKILRDNLQDEETALYEIKLLSPNGGSHGRGRPERARRTRRIA